MTARAPSLKALANAYGANLGRALVEGESCEFTHRFARADLALLREAIDDYFGRAPQFPTLPGLYATYSRLLATSRGNGDSDGAADERARAWLSTDAPRFMGYDWQGNETEPQTAAETKRLMCVAHTEALCVTQSPPPSWGDERMAEIVRVKDARHSLALSGWVYVGRPATKRAQLFFRPDGAWEART